MIAAAALAAAVSGGPAPSISNALNAICLSFVRDDQSERKVADAQHLRRRMEFHPLDGPYWNGHRYDGFPNVIDLRLNTDQVVLMPGVLSRRSCSFKVRLTPAQVRREVEDFVARDTARFSESSNEFDTLTAPAAGTQLYCSRLRPGLWIVTSGSTVAMGAAPPSSTMCRRH